MTNDGIGMHYMCNNIVRNLLHPHGKDWSKNLWTLSEALDHGGIEEYNAVLADMHSNNGNTAGITMRI